MPVTVGTAGHIDHGKTWLVRALTGKDTDRLPEERDRGISIDLGYAPLELADGRRLSLVDVPGHERFVRNMVAGATGIDLFLLAIDAGEGARPQTHEHLAVIRLLGIEHGVVAVTKADAVDPELLDLVVEEARELVPGAEVVVTSAKTGQGLDELRAALGEAADRVEQRSSEGATRLFVDRVFTLRGIGTVVTGTLWSGSIGEGDVLRAEPQGLDVRVRSVQVHDTPVERAEAGQRVAVALPGVERHVPVQLPPRRCARRSGRDPGRDASARAPRDG
jgi:selenocysteine-specific elongation factor